LSGQPIPGIRPLSRNRSGPLRDSLFGLAPDGVFRAASLALRAVVSYTTFSPLPAFLRTPAVSFSVALSVGKPFNFPPACIPIEWTWVTRHRALWCSDFPLPARAESDSPPFQNQLEFTTKTRRHKDFPLRALCLGGENLNPRPSNPCRARNKESGRS
jgi:hypothetical protein